MRKNIVFDDFKFSKLFDLIEKKQYKTLVFLVDGNTEKLCFPHLKSILEELGKEYYLVTIKPGEKNKNFDNFYRVLDHLLELNCDRYGTLLINLGGGVVCDIGGFVASIYKRGMDYVSLPTTLLAMVDASFGGKTGLNYKNFKNIIGTIYLPQKTFITRNFLNTLPKKELYSGFAEMFKHALLADVRIFDEFIKENTPDKIPELKYIKQSINIKYNILKRDLYDKNERQKLNLGHTIGHAIEKWAIENGFDFTHGYCIMLGLIAEIKLSEQIFNFNKTLSMKIIDYIRKYYPLPSFFESDLKKIIEYMKQDKKNKSKTIKFSLLKDVGICVTNIDTNEDLIYNAMLEGYRK